MLGAWNIHRYSIPCDTKQLFITYPVSQGPAFFSTFYCFGAVDQYSNIDDNATTDTNPQLYSSGMSWGEEGCMYTSPSYSLYQTLFIRQLFTTQPASCMSPLSSTSSSSSPCPHFLCVANSCGRHPTTTMVLSVLPLTMLCMMLKVIVCTSPSPSYSPPPFKYPYYFKRYLLPLYPSVTLYIYFSSLIYSPTPQISYSTSMLEEDTN